MISDREDLKRYIQYMLGFPYIEIELTDEQLNYIIDETISKYQKYADVPNELQYLAVQIEPGVSEYNVPEEINSFLRLVNSRRSGINTLFTVENALYHSGRLDFSNFGLVDYYTVQSSIKTLDRLIGSAFNIQYSKATNKINVNPVPNKHGTLLLEVYVTINSPEFYDAEFVKDYSLARAKCVWSMAARKYDTELPDGTKIQLDQLYKEGKDEATEAMEILKSTDSRPPMFFTG